jgi:thiol:disulfide interchange protein|tara:strand:+ start:140 stop:361 length:222 start_codon:yes stop_codon:yes gene_type:complete
LIGLKADEYHKKLRKQNKKEKKKYVAKNYKELQTTLIVFTAQWCETCVNTYSIWIKFANRFTTSKVKVVEVDT